MSTSTATLAPAWAPATRPDGRPWWPSYCSNLANGRRDGAMTNSSAKPPSPEAAAAPPDPAVADAILLARLRAGDASAYDDLVRTHSPRMLAVTRRILNSEDDAKDAVQD